jgi:hypothetical protein
MKREEESITEKQHNKSFFDPSEFGECNANRV